MSLRVWSRLTDSPLGARYGAASMRTGFGASTLIVVTVTGVVVADVKAYVVGVVEPGERIEMDVPAK